MKRLNYIEKTVLMSVLNGFYNVTEIHRDTLVSPVMIKNVLSNLVKANLVKKTNNVYLPQPYSRHSLLWKPNKEEVFELVNKAYDSSNDFHFKLAKFREDDFKEYIHLSQRLKGFIHECNKRNKIPTKNQRYVFWGQVPQNQTIQHSFQ